MSEANLQEEALQRMIQILVEKQEILRDLLRFTNQQQDMLAVKAEDLPVEAFTQVLSERETLMERADHLDEAFLKEFSYLKTFLQVDSLDSIPPGVLDASLVRELQLQVKKVQDLVTGLTQVDDENRSVMAQQMATLKKEISQVQQGKKAIHGYANTKHPQPSLFMDEKETTARKKK